MQSQHLSSPSCDTKNDVPQIFINVQALIDQLSNLPASELLQEKLDGTELTANFKIPLKWSGLNLQLQYDVITGNVNLNFTFLGKENCDFIKVIPRVATLECLYLGGNLKDGGKYDDSQKGYALTWMFPENRLGELTKELPEIISRYSFINHVPFENRNIYEVMKKYNNINISDSLQQLPKEAFSYIQKTIVNSLQSWCGYLKEIPYQNIFFKDAVVRNEMFLTLIANCRYNFELNFKKLKQFFESLTDREKNEVLSLKDKNNDNPLTLAAYTCEKELVDYFVSYDVNGVMQQHKNCDGLTYQDLKVFRLLEKNKDGESVKRALENKLMGDSLENHLSGHTLRKSVAHQVFDTVAYMVFSATPEAQVETLEKLLFPLSQDIMNESMLYQGQMSMNSFVAAVPHDPEEKHELKVLNWLLSYYTGDKASTLTRDCHGRNYIDALNRYLKSNMIAKEDYQYITSFLRKFGLQLDGESKSTLSNQFTQLVIKGEIEKLKEMKSGLPSKFFKEMLSNQNMERLLKSCPSTEVINWLSSEPGVFLNIKHEITKLFKDPAHQNTQPIHPVLDPLFLGLKKINDISLENVIEKKSTITTVFDVPLKFDHARLTMIYHVQSKNIDLRFQYFGNPPKPKLGTEDMDDYLDMVSKFAILDCLYLQGKMRDLPVYNGSTKSLDFRWKFEGSNINLLAKFIPNVMERYTQLNMASYETSDVDDFFKQYQGNNIDISASLRQLPTQHLEIVKKMIMNYVTALYSGAKEIPYQNIILKNENICELFFTLIKNARHNTDTHSLPLLKSFFEKLSPSEKAEVLSHRDANNDNALTLAAYTCQDTVINYILSEDTNGILRNHKNCDGLNYQDIGVFQLVENRNGKAIIEAFENKLIDFNIKNHLTGHTLKQAIAHAVFDIVTYGKYNMNVQARVDLLEKLLGPMPQYVVNDAMLYEGQMSMNSFVSAVPKDEVPNHELVVFDWLVDHYTGDKNKMLSKDSLNRDYTQWLEQYMNRYVTGSENIKSFTEKYLSPKTPDILKQKNKNTVKTLFSLVTNEDHLEVKSTFRK